MPRNEPEQLSVRGRSCFSYGCLAAVALAVILAAWVVSGFVFWNQCRIPLPGRSGSVVYMARLNKVMCAEWDRKVQLDTTAFRGREVWIPGDSGGADPVKVYWYPARGRTGAFLRFQDPLWEYLVDLKRGKSLLMAREQSGHAYVGDMVPDKPDTCISGPTLDKDGKVVNEKVVVEICGRPGRRLEDRVARTPGEYIGRIEYPFNHFVSSKESPEAPLPLH